MSTMWTARSRWSVRNGALESAVVLVQGSHADWEDTEGEESVTDGNWLILAQPDTPAPCELTIDFPDASFFVSLIRLSSSARTCEVYSRKLGSQDHEYVCTVRGKEHENPPKSPALPDPPESSARQPPPGSPASTSPLEAKGQSPSESQDREPDKTKSGPGSTPQVTSPQAKPVPFYTCGIKLARGPALTSLRLKFVSLQNKAELQIQPIAIYASRGPASAPPPRLMNSSLSALAPLLPALGPLLSSGVPGLPQLPGAFSHLLPPQQGAARPEACLPGTRGEDGTEKVGSGSEPAGQGVKKLMANSGHSQPVMPEGLAQLMASMQGLRAGGVHSHPATGASSHLARSASGSVQRPPFDLAGLMAAVGRNGGGVLQSGVAPLEPSMDSGAVNRTDARNVNEPGVRGEGMKRGDTGAEGHATLEAILRRLEGLEGTCLRIERAVTGALRGFDARLTRLEERDMLRGDVGSVVQGSSKRNEGGGRVGGGGTESVPGTDERASLGAGSIVGEGQVAGAAAVLGLKEGARMAVDGGGAQVINGGAEAVDFTNSGAKPVGHICGADKGVKDKPDDECPKREGDSSREERVGQMLPLGTAGDALERVSYEEAEAASVL